MAEMSEPKCDLEKADPESKFKDTLPLEDGEGETSVNYLGALIVGLLPFLLYYLCAASCALIAAYYERKNLEHMKGPSQNDFSTRSEELSITVGVIAGFTILLGFLARFALLLIRTLVANPKDFSRRHIAVLVYWVYIGVASLLLTIKLAFRLIAKFQIV